MVMSFGPLAIMLFNTGSWLLKVRDGDAVVEPISLTVYGVLTGLAALWAFVFLKRTARPK